MSAINDNEAVTTRTELLRSLQNEQTKQHMVYDGTGRPKLLFEAIVTSTEGDPCLCTEYVYLGPTGTNIKDRQERVYKWKAAWDGGYIFDPATDYDPDGDGNL